MLCFQAKSVQKHYLTSKIKNSCEFFSNIFTERKLNTQNSNFVYRTRVFFMEKNIIKLSQIPEAYCDNRNTRLNC